MRAGLPRVALLTREYPPDVYGGAGVHVEHLSRELRRRVELTVHCWGPPRRGPRVVGHEAWMALSQPQPEAAALQAMSIDLAMVAACRGTQLVHSHTWYTNLAGHLAKLTWGVPHVVTAHSLEPLRPWKAEQLGGGYALSTFCEHTGLVGADAVIAVSEGMRRDIASCYPEVDPGRVHVIHNGVDASQYRPVRAPDVLRRHGVDPDRSYVLYVGRVSRQKGLPRLLRAARRLGGHQVVVCAGAADTAEVAAEVAKLADRLRAEQAQLVWIEGMLPRAEVVALMSGATVFACPSVYEPFGLVNLEAMACATAVVAAGVGGIPEIVLEGRTGFLVAEGSEEAFEVEFAARVQQLLEDPGLADRMGQAGRSRVLERFTWEVVADRTVEVYRSLL